MLERQTLNISTLTSYSMFYMRKRTRWRLRIIREMNGRSWNLILKFKFNRHLWMGKTWAEGFFVLFLNSKGYVIASRQPPFELPSTSAPMGIPINKKSYQWFFWLLQSQLQRISGFFFLYFYSMVSICNQNLKASQTRYLYIYLCLFLTP